MPTVLVTGASGYVGGRLVPALLDAGFAVRCLARTPAKLDAAPWRTSVEVIRGEVGGDLAEAMAGVDVAVYLVHSIGQGGQWSTTEHRDAANFGRAARKAGVGRIIYLGGLGDDAEVLSEHLSSRHKVGELLRESGVDTAEFRAGVVIGSGSASFEMLRSLVEVLPVMVTPRWINNQCQPIAIADVIQYLVAACQAEGPAIGGIYEIGGPDVVTYAEMMALYAEVAQLPRRRLLSVPLLTPGLSSHWVGLVTPVPVPLARELVKSLINEVVVRHHGAEERFGVHPMSLRTAMTRALAAVQDDRVPTTFSDADLLHFATTATDPEWSGGTIFKDTRTATTSAGASAVFSAVTSVGGNHGWYSGEFLWRVRGLIDQLAGGPGLRRGRKAVLTVGDPLDFWRVEDLVHDRRLRLHAEMAMPGDAWLTWDIEETERGTVVTQTALYRPHGLSGRLYWYSVAPFHGFVFPGMLSGIVRDAELRASS